MRALFDGRWIDGLADCHRRPGEVRIEVVAARPLERLEGLYPVRGGRDLRVVWNYARTIGARATLRKVASRTGERRRNAKLVSCGLGRILEPAEDGRLGAGQAVVFLLPAGPACVERWVVPETLLLPVEAERLPAPAGGGVLFAGTLPSPDEPHWWAAFRGWRPESGEPLSPFGAGVALKEAQRMLLDTDWSTARHLPAGATGARTVLTATSTPRAGRGRKRAVLFGYGNYAKTIILPRIRRHLGVEAVHEIDPTQIPRRRGRATTWRTAPGLAPDERPDAVLIAGYHHTHAAIACDALRRGAAAVVEKPIATTRAQLRELLRTMRETGGAVFSGYQRRYLPFNERLRADLGVGPQEPISYHAIVYEVPLPALHWYRWPSARSRLLSNGCHWIDHFLHLNGYPAARDLDVRVAPDGTVNCTVTAENGAFFTMVLTDRGSRRLGVRDHVELHASGATARIVDACAYEVEDGRRVVHRARIGRLEPYRLMYDAIGRRIAAGEAGDPIRSIERSAGLVLDLEERMQTDAVQERALRPLLAPAQAETPPAEAAWSLPFGAGRAAAAARIAC